MEIVKRVLADFCAIEIVTQVEPIQIFQTLQLGASVYLLKLCNILIAFLAVQSVLGQKIIVKKGFFRQYSWKLRVLFCENDSSFIFLFAFLNSWILYETSFPDEKKKKSCNTNITHNYQCNIDTDFLFYGIIKNFRELKID